ncbi:MAG: hypothetical protein HEP71_07390 [Roseivirga sp.]|nr:hypothetical protein [Roseivirga sp.]
MDLRKQLLTTHSKENTTLIANYIGSDRERFDKLMKLFLYDEYRVIQRAAWVVGDVSRLHPEIVMPYLPEMVENLKKPDIHDASKRNTLRFLQEIEVPEAHWGDLAELCFNYLTSIEEPVAIKVFSMTVLLGIVKKVPELKDELKYAIEDQLPYGSAGFKSRGKKTLKVLEKV